MEVGSHILFLVSNDHFTDQRMQRICGTLHDAGYQITIVGRDLNATAKQFPYKVELLSLVNNSGPRFYLELMKKQIEFAMSSKAFTIISSVDSDTLLAARNISKELGIKHVHDAHELFSEIPELKGKWLKKRIWRFVERIGLKDISYGYTVSRGLKEYYDQKGNVNFDLIYNYPKKKEAIASSIKYDVIYQGAINKGRCLEVLIKAAIKHKFTLVVCGTGDKDELIKNLAKGQSNIHLMGRVDPKELHKITCQSKIGFNVLDNSSLSYDKSMPNKTFDYIMAEIPQLITASKELQNINNQLPFAISVNPDMDSIGNAIHLLLKEGSKYTELKENCKTLKLKWNWESQSAKLLSIYKNV